MTSQHTPGPWFTDNKGPSDIRRYIMCNSAKGYFGAIAAVKLVNEDSEQNARRIVACVNACEGIDTDLMEGFSPRFLATLPDRHLEQRNDLLKALRRLSFAAMARDNTMGDQCALLAAQAELRDANKQAMEVIAKATGSAV